MMYEFEDVATGRVVEVQMSMRDAVPIGSEFTHEGRRLRRIPSMPGMSVQETLHFVSGQLPRNWPHAKQHHPDGSPRFESWGEIRESLARAKDHGEQIEYGGDAMAGWGGDRKRARHGEF